MGSAEKTRTETSNGIGTYRESSLHAEIKAHMVRPGDRLETEVEGFVIDIVRDDQLVEIQTGQFGALKSKLDRLLKSYSVEVVLPVVQRRWIRRVDKNLELISRRKSPKQGRLEELFGEVMRIPRQATHPHFRLRVLMIHEEVTWRNDGLGSWRRKGWSVADHKLLEIIEERTFDVADDYLSLLPPGLNDPFTNKDLAERLGIRNRLAGQMSYALRKMGLVQIIGKQNRYLLMQVK